MTTGTELGNIGNVEKISKVRERARLIRGATKQTVIGSAVNGLLLAGAFVACNVAWPVPGVWLALLATTLAFRIVISSRFDPDAGDSPQRRLLRWFAVSAFLSGTVWGLTGLSLFFIQDDLLFGIVAFVLAGLSAGVTTSFRSYARAAQLFLAPALLPLVLYFAARGTVIEMLMAATVLFFGWLMVLVAKNGERGMRKTLSIAETARDAARRLQVIADYTYAWEGWVGEGGKVEWINPSVERVTGYSVEECFAMEDYPFAIIHPDDREWARDRTVVARAQCEPFKFEFRIVRKDGEIRWCDVESQPALDKNGKLHGHRASIRDVTETVEMRKELERLATTDPLTGAFNRRQFFELCEREVYRAARHDQQLVIAMLDIDHFKSINDRHGHAAGDQCLKAFVAVIRQSIRKTDVLARVGGEEFALLMPETPPDAAERLCDRLRRKVGSKPVTVGETAVPMTVSIGLSRLDSMIGDIEAALGRADEALYTAKSSGRNKVVVHREGLERPEHLTKRSLRAATA